MKIITCGIMWLSLITGCSTAVEEQAGSEIGNPTIAGVTTSERSGAPIESSVYLYKQHAKTPIDSTVADGDGKYAFNVQDSGNYYIEIYSSETNELAYVPHIAVIDNSTQHIESVLKKPGSIVGRVVMLKNSVVHVALAESSFETVLDSNGYYIFEEVPEGNFTVVARIHSEEALTTELIIKSVQTVSGDTVRAEYRGEVAQGLVLDDFEDRNEFNALQPITGWGNWYVKTDSSLGSSTTIMPENNYPTSFFEATSFVDSLRMHSLHLIVALDNADTAFAGIGVNVGAAPVDFSNLTTFQFEARGPATVEVSFVHVDFDQVSPTEYRFVHVVTLTKDWQMLAITPEQLTPMSTHGVTLDWEQVKTRIMKIEFLVQSLANQQQVEIVIDNLIFVGMSIDDIIAQ